MGFEEAKKSLKAFLHPVIYNASLWRCVETIPLLRAVVPPWQRTHPFDRQYGTDTSGLVPVDMLVSDKALQSQMMLYGGSQPSIIRRALIALGNVEEYAFVDLGCGKGRPLLVASEFPFRSVSGVELSSRLVKIARHNVATAEHRFPMRSSPAVIEGNAVAHPLPEGNLALFFYHSFSSDLLSQLIKKLEETVARGNGYLFFIYYNPVYGDLLDASPAFTRWYAENLNYDESEFGFGPDTADTVVIWRSVNGTTATPHEHADRRIIITKPLWKAELAP